VSSHVNRTEELGQPIVRGSSEVGPAQFPLVAEGSTGVALEDPISANMFWLLEGLVSRMAQ